MNRTHLKFLRTRASKVVLHSDGTISYRLTHRGPWHHRVTNLSREDFMQLANSDREKLWYEGISRRRDFVEVGQVGAFLWP